MIKYFERFLNFTTRQFVRKDGSWGKMIENSEKEEVDLISTSYTVFGTRIYHVDYLSPITTAKLGFAIRGIICDIVIIL